MNIEQKREQVAYRMSVARLYDAEYSTSILHEFYTLHMNGCKAVCDLQETDLDNYLNTHDEDGQPQTELVKN